MDQPLILALDQGTTSTRAILFAADGQPLAEAGAPLQQHYPQDGWVEHDAEEIFEASVRVLKAAVEKAGRTLAEVAAIGITNQRETLVVWEKATGRPIHKAIVWQDRRTEAMCVRLRDAGHERRVTEITGLLLDPYFSGTKLAWLLGHVAGAREAAAAGELLAGTIDAWVIWKLTGGKVHATDATNASRTLLYDIRAGRWSTEMGGMLGVPLDLLPEVRDCAGAFGETDAEILGRAIPIRGVAGDQQAALMGQGCIRPGEMKATYGTGCFMLINTGEAAPVSGARLLTTVAARVAGRTTYALEGAIFIAGAAIQWLGEGLGIEGGPRAAEALAMGARDDLPVVLVPAFTGLGAPWWDANARGAIFGLTRDAGRPEIARAAFDACALQTRDLIEAMRADAPQAFKGQVELRIDGGMSRSPWFSQRLADLTGIGVCRATYQETTALGAALFAGLGAGIYRDMDEAAAARPATESYRPLMAPDPRERAYARWLDAVNRVGTI
ncbi:MAG: glycerol kinase [Phenylobacterium sp. RIFCSPHIGHO2_01_FULL_69_31]|uniref:glycerol kinase GlpK n=1 Tax=Phenylobacterium sp. RIFCSPHIGHO2_01_FULL_69_31 TaxID=1801944 RepID=UPI0008CEA2EE|nr:glycerol kinase GlpK [Phenylobacterium sp. RIFCSPHIGHO2_01_FULL_69_31]OHB31409.1 MAG: glycerol kinase [Phenylobacterium sp. RIFCSPHIGHO2_01_FULL_69_31]